VKPAHFSLRNRVVLVIVATVLATSAVFGVVTFVFAYMLEDRLFASALANEVERQQQGWQRDGSLPDPELAYIRIYRNKADLPADLAAQIDDNGEQDEFYGTEGRHYHIAPISLGDAAGRLSIGSDTASALAVAEVSRYLLVRPDRDAMAKFLIGLSLFIATAMALMGSMLANRAMRPLGRLASDVADAGRAVPVVRAEDYPEDEIGMLARALGHAFDRIRGFVDREQAFTRDASHELRTPLAVIRGAAEVIALRPDLPRPVPGALRRIETAIMDMTLTLDLLLELAREGVVGPAKPVALSPFVEKAISYAMLRHPESQISVDVQIPVDAMAAVDPTSLQLVLNNLIGNSFQHAGTGTLVVSFDDACLMISDDGPGLEHLSDPFTAFEKGSSSEGSGLGLDISRRLCAAAGIALRYSQGANGRGSRFSLKFSAL